MSRNVTNLEVSSVIINGHRIEGWSDAEDALTMPSDEELYAHKTGADGLMMSASTASHGGEVGIKLLENSPSAKVLQQIVSNYRVGIDTEVQGLVIYKSGPSTNLINGLLSKAPKGISKGKGNVGELVYTFTFQRIEFDLN